MIRSDELRAALPALLDPAPSHPLPPDTALAAVLVPVLASGPVPRVVFTRRSDTLSRHAGEISFPGGFADPGEDASLAALREAREELGLEPGEVELLGALPPVHTRVTGVLIVPFVGVLGRDPRFTPNPAEITEVLEFPLARLEQVGAERELEVQGYRFHSFVYELDGHLIWGATARILWSLIEALRAAGLVGRATERRGGGASSGPTDGG